MAKKGLGRGLDALMFDNSIKENDSGGVMMLKISDIEPNREQARKRFDETALSELADSITLHGILQPITVRKKSNGYYEIIAGERRWRAGKMAGLNEIPALVREADDINAAELSLIENLQREDLNAVEEAIGYRDLMEKFDLTQEEAAEKVGKSRTAVANLLRILKLPGRVLSMVEDGSISYGHARALLPLAQIYDESEIKKYADNICRAELSVRQTEQMVRNALSDSRKQPPNHSAVAKEYYKKLENNISEVLSRKANIHFTSDGKGRISLFFSDNEDLETLLKHICGKDFFENDNN